MSQVMGGLVLTCKCVNFLYVFSYCELLCWLVPLQTYIWQKKIWVLLIDLLQVENNILHYCVHSEENDKEIKRVE